MRYFVIVVLSTTTAACKHSKEQSKTPKKESTVKAKTPVTKPEKHNDEWQEKIGLTSREIKNNKFYSFISDWYGVPYKYGGCQKAGVDCSCFTNILYELRKAVKAMGINSVAAVASEYSGTKLCLMFMHS